MTSKVCPRCGRIYTRPPALSRRDNITEICSECGIREALDAMQIRQNAPGRRFMQVGTGGPSKTSKQPTIERGLKMNILNAKITKVVWERERVLTQYIYVEGNGWVSCFGGYDLRGEACSRWLENLMETLGLTSFSDQNLVGLNVRVGFGGDGGIGSPIEAIGHIINDRWFNAKILFSCEGNGRTPVKRKGDLP